VPLWASFLTDVAPGPQLTLRLSLVATDDLGRERQSWSGERTVPFAPWTSKALDPVEVKMPDRRGVAILRATLEDAGGRVLQRNFTTFVVGQGASPRDEPVAENGRSLRVLRAAADSAKGQWTERDWKAMDGRKRNGAGAGWFEYRLPWPADLKPEAVAGATFVAELGAKELFAKDRPEPTEPVEGDFMRGGGTADRGRNPNAYPMTDTKPSPSAVRVLVNGISAGAFDLPDDPADHRGVVSWLAQKRSEKPTLSEAGSYGYLVTATVPAASLEAAARTRELVIRLQVDEALPGGLAVYGEGSGRYAVDPSLVLTLR
jgi:hypothetical protein